MTEAFRCARESSALAEPLPGTASTVRAFLLLECAGPWGVHALQDCRLPDSLSAELERRCAAAGVRPLLVRRHGRARSGPGVRCFAAYADPAHPWAEAAVLDTPEQVLDLPLERLGDGLSLGLPAHQAPLFLVCTHGRHDACCAERGRPLAAALSAAHPDLAWECSHIGGDRFAGNVLVLPDGLYYGRADPVSGPRIAAAHLAGRLDLEHLRGRAGYGFATQAAEWHLRRHLDLTGVDQLRLSGQRSHDGVTEAVFTLAERPAADTRAWRWQVRVRQHRGAPQQLTCRSGGPRRPLLIELLGIHALQP